VDLNNPIVMGILNVTPDSFYDGGHHENIVNAMQKVEEIVREGAAIVDVGGMSSRPSAEIISVEEELGRVIPIIKEINTQYPDQIISIDTVHGKVAQAAIDAGASMINDISGGSIDPSIIDVALEHDVPYILMHMQGKPSDMQSDPQYDDVVMDILTYLKNKVYELRNRGMKDLIIDPGFGFGKTIAQNFTLLKKMSVFRILDCPILVGLSRKSMLYKSLDITPDQALNSTTAAHMIALQNGAKILRVHDVKEALEAIKIYNFTK